MREGPFHDHLGLASSDLDGIRLVVFRGRSGSGKSSYVRWLLENHPELRGGDVAVVDEILHTWELPLLARVTRRSRLTLAASHLPTWVHRTLRPLGRLRVYDLDRGAEKIRLWLAARGVASSATGRAEFTRRFGANYTDAELLLERYPGVGFDRALARFTRECRIRHLPAERAGPLVLRRYGGGAPSE